MLYHAGAAVLELNPVHGAREPLRKEVLRRVRGLRLPLWFADLQYGGTSQCV